MLCMKSNVPDAPEPGLKEVSSEPSAFKRAMRLRAVPLTLVKEPPIRIFPSDCRVIARTCLSVPDPGLKEVSREPSAFKRAMLLRAVPLTLVKVPPMRIFPSDCTATACTWPIAPLACGLGLKEVSSEPSAFRRAMPSRAVPLMLLNEPNTMILPSDCRARLLTKAAAGVSKTLGLKHGSTSPVAATEIGTGSCEISDCPLARRDDSALCGFDARAAETGVFCQKAAPAGSANANRAATPVHAKRSRREPVGADLRVRAVEKMRVRIPGLAERTLRVNMGLLLYFTVTPLLITRNRMAKCDSR